MIRNYLKVTFRNIVKNKLFSTINIIGLVTGMAATILILLYIQYELNYNKNFTNYDHIYCLVRNYNIGGESAENPSTPYGLSQAAMQEEPSVLTATKTLNMQTIIKYKNNTFKERVCYTDSLYFKIFDYQFIAGNAENAIKNPDEIIITESAAKKFFGTENPLGKVLLFDESINFRVGSIIKDIPSNSNFKFGIFAPISDFNNGIPDDKWFNNYFRTFVLLNKNSNLKESEKKITDIYLSKMDDDDIESRIIFQNLSDFHFANSQMSKLNISLFFAVGVLILILACINYMNLNTAKYIKRSKEVGIRKILGARREQLIKQFYGETFFMSITSAFLAILLVENILPYFNHIAHIETTVEYLSKNFIIIILSVILFSGLLAGSYPALFLSSLKVMGIIKGQLGTFKLNTNLRKALVIFQFTIATTLLISMGIIYKQFHYMLNKDIGFTTENLLYLQMNKSLKKNYTTFKSSLLSNPEIAGVTKTSFLPMNIFGLINNLNWEGRENQDKTAIAFQVVEADHLRVVDYELIEGRFLSDEFLSDSNAVVINQKAQKLMNYKNPVGKKIMFGDTEADGVLNIIGVVKDFHTLPVNEESEPVILTMYFPEYYNYILIKLNGKANNKAIQFISEKWDEFSPGFPFEYEFMADRIKNMYGDTQNTANVFTLFVIVAIFISCAGLFGLSAFVVEQKTKEIGIRKALGATSNMVFVLLNKTFTKWVIISIIIGSPVAYIFMNKWLKNFANHINPGISIILGAALIILIIAQLTVSFQTLKTAKSNPVDSLRYE